MYSMSCEYQVLRNIFTLQLFAFFFFNRQKDINFVYLQKINLVECYS